MLLSDKKALEKKIEEALKKAVEKRLKGLCLKFLPFHFTGFPDRIVILPGKVVEFVELKAPGRSPKKRQRYVHRQLGLLGFEVQVIDSLEAVDRLVHNYIKNLYA